MLILCRRKNFIGKTIKCCGEQQQRGFLHLIRNNLSSSHRNQQQQHHEQRGSLSQPCEPPPLATKNATSSITPRPGNRPLLSLSCVDYLLAYKT